MIRLTKPDAQGSIESIRSVLEDGFLVQGKHVERFEAMVAAYTRRKFAVAVNSGTSAIQCALLAVGVGEGDEVIVPDFTFPASANAVVACGAIPVLADIDIGTFDLNVASLEAEITPRTKAVMPVDLFGLGADMPAIESAACRHGLAVVEDAACALGSSVMGKMCGAFGAASAISFHPRKIVTTAEGGMVLTDSASAVEEVRRLRNHGMDTSGGVTRFVAAGYNMRMNEIQACLGIDQMGRIDCLVEGRRRAARWYGELLRGVGGVRAPVEPEGYVHTYQSYVVLLDGGIDRDAVIRLMKASGVETAIGTYAVHEQPFYRNRFGYKPGSLPSSALAFRQGLSLPMYASLDEATVGEVVGHLKECIAGARRKSA
jgi:perosamine synthetase